MYRTDFTRCPTDGGELIIAVTDPLIGATIAEHYTIDTLIGEGAMGRVYRAHHSRLVNKRYALKILIGDLAASARMRIRFANEAENASRLDHPNIVGVVDFGRAPTGLMYLVMELVEGPTLGDLVRRHPFAPARAMRLVRQLCDGLGHAHARGVVHRDFKPDNILVVGELDQEIARIADFGLAISMADEDARLTTSGVLCTPAYAAPEQLLGQAIDHRADLYALGVTLFEMLTGGIMPFGCDPQLVTGRKLAGPTPSIHAVAPDVPAQLAAAIERLLALDPADRFQHAGEVIVALEVGSAKPLAVAATQLAPVQRVRRPRAGRVVAAVGLAGAVIGLLSIAQHDPPSPTVDAGADTRTDDPALAPASIPAPRPAPIARPEAPRERRVVNRPAAKRPVAKRSAKKPVASAPAKLQREPVEEALPEPEPPASSNSVIDPWPRAVPATEAAAIVQRPSKPPPPAITDLTPRIVGLDVEGSLARSVVRRAIDRVLPDLAACARQSGIVTARFAIEDTRRATGVTASGPSAACVSNVLAGARTEVAPDVGGAEVSVRIQFGGGS
jgi:serine/threonine-protein kinase